MTFATSPISYGEYTFPAGFTVLDQEQQFTIEEAKVPLRYRDKADPGYMAARIVRIGGYVGGEGAVDSSGALIDTFEKAEAEANKIIQVCSTPFTLPTLGAFSGQTQQYLPLVIGAGDGRMIMAQVASEPKVEYLVGSGRRAIFVTVDFLGADPAWIDASPTVTNPSVASGIATGTYSIGGSTKTWPDFYWLHTFHVLTGTSTLRVTYLQLDPLGSKYIELTIPAAVQYNYGGILIQTHPKLRGIFGRFGSPTPAYVDLVDVIAEDLTGQMLIKNTVGDGEFFPYFLPGSNQVDWTLRSSASALQMTHRKAFLF